MLYLGLALYAEGRTDERFLSPLLLRLCGDICGFESTRLVEINDEVLVLAHSAKAQDAGRENRILEAAKQASGAWSILFVHADADRDAKRARQRNVSMTLRHLAS